MPWKGEGTLHLDHLSIWIYTDKGPELSQLRDTSLYILVRGLKNLRKRSLSLPSSQRCRDSRGERGADSAMR
jgi:hypothetical protein